MAHDFKLVGARDGTRPDPRRYGDAVIVTCDDEQIAWAVRDLLELEFDMTVGVWRREHEELNP